MTKKQVAEPIIVSPHIPISVSELAKYHPLDQIAKHGGGYLTTYGHTKKVRLDFDPKREGFIELSVGKETALIHKDELLFVARFAKGSAAV